MATIWPSWLRPSSSDSDDNRKRSFNYLDVALVAAGTPPSNVSYFVESSKCEPLRDVRNPTRNPLLQAFMAYLLSSLGRKDRRTAGSIEQLRNGLRLTNKGAIFFTKNGRFLGIAFCDINVQVGHLLSSPFMARSFH